MSADNLYLVTIMRVGVAANIQLNFTDKEAALHAFAKLNGIVAAKEEGITKREIVQDSFGSRLYIGPEEIGGVLFQDNQRLMEFSIAKNLMEARAQARLQAQANADPILNGSGKIVMAQPSGLMPRA